MFFFSQARQRRASQRVVAAPAAQAPIALQAAGVTTAMRPQATAARAAASERGLFDQRDAFPGIVDGADAGAKLRQFRPGERRLRQPDDELLEDQAVHSVRPMRYLDMGMTAAAGTSSST